MVPAVKPVLHFVWFKRDLRVFDHAPLDAAMRAGGLVRALYVFEPSQLRADDHAPMHTAFVLQSLADLRQRLAGLGVPLWIRVGEVIEVLDTLADTHTFAALYSHEETGNLRSYARDRAVRRWCRARGVPWHEYWQTGVLRPHKERDGWAKAWQARMTSPLVSVPNPQNQGCVTPDPLPTLADLGVDAVTHEVDHLGGERAAEGTVATFLEARARDYERHISSPNSALWGGSRLSSYLAYGNVSMRSVVQHTLARRRQAARDRDLGLVKSLDAFLSRLAWHCHFMQKLEDEPELEERHAHASMVGLRNEGPRSAQEERRLRAWRAGKTGYPMIDAVMRCLLRTGWINFRMRAMLVSFACYDLWLDWRPVALHLARNFIDYEPGIHYPQVQMQAGTTGNNTLRMYNPTRQLHEHDPEAVFVRTWVPELAGLNPHTIGALHELGRQGTEVCGVRLGVDYPMPIVQHSEAVRQARARLEGLRRQPDFGARQREVQARHGSRRRLRR